MILTCPNCSKRFLLSAQLLAPEGRRVKCSNCAEEWFQLPDPDELIEDLEEHIEDIPESVKPLAEDDDMPLPAIRPHDEDEEEERGKGAPFAYAAAAGVFVVLLAVFVFMKDPIFKMWPASAALYQMMGMSLSVPGEGLVFDRVSVSHSDGKTIVEGFIINLTQTDQDVPFIEATLKDQFGGVLKTWMIEPPEKMLTPESTLPFKAMVDSDVENPESVGLRFILK